MRAYTISCILLAASSFTAAEPLVVALPGDHDDFVVEDSNEMLPSLNFRVDRSGNSFDLNSARSPLIFEYPNQSGTGAGLVYQVQVPASVDAHYTAMVGDVVSADLPGWRDVLIRDSDSSDIWQASLPTVIDDPNNGCGTDSSLVGIQENHHYYIPFRTRQYGDSSWYYGWASFRVLTNPSECCFDPDFCITVTSARFDYNSYGIETTVDTSIVVGGGACEADLNFDAQRDFFDVSEFLSRYSNGDLSVDFDGNGTLDFFDVSAFLGAFTAECLP